MAFVHATPLGVVSESARAVVKGFNLELAWIPTFGTRHRLLLHRAFQSGL